MLDMYETKTFSQVYPELDDFTKNVKEDYSEYAKNALTDDNLTALYFMLYAKYGNTPMINLSEEIFKAKVVSTIFQKGPTWQRKLKLQEDIRALQYSEVYKALEKEDVPLVQNPIKKTNVILKNVNFQYAMKLWDFIMDQLQQWMLLSVLQQFQLCLSLEQIISTGFLQIFLEL